MGKECPALIKPNERLLMKHFSIKKTASLLLAGLLTLGACACSSAGAAGSNGKLKIVTTIFPEYDWVKEIAGDKISNIDLTLLLDNGVDLHSYQPTAQDIIKISSCDVFVYVGGESDEWVEDALKEAVNKNMQVVNLMETLGSAVKEEEVVEGMQVEDEHDHDHGDDKDHDKDDHDHGDDKDEHDHDHDEEETEYDEHVWLSLKNAKVLVNGIADAMGKADPSNAASYKANAENYNKKLSDLDSKYEETVKSSGKNTVLFGDRFPFRYLTDDYGLKYYAAFVGCSAETEASFETIVFLSGKLDELGLKTVLVIDKSDKKIAQTVVNNTKSKDQEILVMDSLQSTSASDSSKGVSYISVMEKNLEVLS